MKKHKKNTWVRVVIHWIDSTHYREPWWNAKDFIDYVAKKENKNEMISTGFLFHQDKDFYYLSNSIDFHGDKVAHFGGIFAIPKGYTKKVAEVKK